MGISLLYGERAHAGSGAEDEHTTVVGDLRWKAVDTRAAENVFGHV